MQLSFSQSRVGLLPVKIFKAIFHSLYRYIIWSNTENIVSSFLSIAGNKRQESHSHSFCNYSLSKTISHCLPEWITGTPPRQNFGFCKAGEPVTSGIARFFTLDGVPINIQCWERLCTQLANHVACWLTGDANFPCPVRIPMT